MKNNLILIILFLSLSSLQLVAQEATIYSNGIITETEISFYSLENIGTKDGGFKTELIDSIRFKTREDKFSPLYSTLEYLDIPYSFTQAPVKPTNKDIQDIQLAIEQFRIQRNTGYTLQAVGFSFLVIGAIVANQNPDSPTGNVMMITGGLTSLSGFMVTWTAGNKLKFRVTKP